jgi:integrase
MARTVRDENLGSRTARAKLKARGKPYYRSLDEGVHLGYRKSRDSGKWVGRFYLGERVYKVETIAVTDDKADPDGVAVLSFAQAQRAIRQRYVEITQTAKNKAVTTNGPYTVQACLQEYQRYLEARTKSATDARYRIETLILPELGDTPCNDLTKDHLTNWLNSIAMSRPRLRTRKGEEQRYRDIEDSSEARRRRRSSANRVFTWLKAALNAAWRDGKIASDRAWRTLTPFEEADAVRPQYLTHDQSRRLINATQGAFRTLAQAGLLTGGRYGELAALEVRDFNPDVGTLHVRVAKGGKGRHIELTEEGIEFFSSLTAGRPGSEPMLGRPEGSRWGKSHQTRPMLEACKRAGIVPAVGFHTLRHTYASLALMAGATPLVIATNLGHTDTRMVEKHYGHLPQSHVRDEIRRTAPRFGIEPGNVRLAGR